MMWFKDNPFEGKKKKEVSKCRKSEKMREKYGLKGKGECEKV
jgi:hypothetical protein